MPSKHLKTLIKLLIYIISIVLIFILTPKLIRFFIPLILGWLVSLIASPIVMYFEKHFKVVRKHESWLVIVGVLGLVVGACYYIIGAITKELIAFVGGLPEAYSHFSQNILLLTQSINGTVGDKIVALVSNMESSIGEFMTTMASPLLGVAGEMAKNIPNLLVMMIFMFLAAYFFIADKDKVNQLFKSLIPQAVVEKFLWLKTMFSRAVGGYFIAQFKIMGVIAIILWIGLIVLKVKYALLWAVIIAMLDFLPFFGTGFVIWPWSVYELVIGNYSMVLGLLGLYLICLFVHQLLQPKFVGNTVGMDSFTTLICMFIGYRISSVIGMILAVPIGIIIINLHKEGAFNPMISDIKEMMRDFGQYLKG